MSAIKYSGNFTRPAEPVEPKAVGDRFIFDSIHWSVNERNGEVCEVVEVREGLGFPYMIAFLRDAKRVEAVDRELLPLEAKA